MRTGQWEMCGLDRCVCERRSVCICVFVINKCTWAEVGVQTHSVILFTEPLFNYASQLRTNSYLQ